MNRLQKAIQQLTRDHLSCIALKGDHDYISNEKGLRPLMVPLRQDPDFFRDAFIIDRVIGKSAAFLLIKGRIKGLHAILISQHAVDLLEKHNIPFTYDQLVPYIINDAHTDMCPMEKTVLKIENVDEAVLALEAKIKIMMANKSIIS